MRKKLLLILLALCVVSLLSTAALAADAPTGEIIADVEIYEADPVTERSQSPVMLLSDSTNVQLKSEPAVLCIDRVDVPQIILDFYAALEEASDNDSEGDWLIDPEAYSDELTVYNGGYVYLMPYTEADFSTHAEHYAESGLNTYITHCLRTAFYAFENDHPEVFWLGSAFVGRFTAGSTTYLGLTLYTQTGTVYGDGYTKEDGMAPDTDKIKEDIKALDASVNAILSAVDGKSGYEKLAYFNKWLTTNNQYSSASSSVRYGAAYRSICALTPTENSDAGGRIREEGPVCEAYSRAFQLLCQRAGINNCFLVDGASHMWNYVSLDGENWYAVDVTWNDPTGDTNARSVSGGESARYFMVGSSTSVDGGVFLTETEHPVELTVTAGGGTIILANFNMAPSIEETVYDESDIHSFSAITVSGAGGSTNVLAGGALQLEASDSVSSQDITDIVYWSIPTATDGASISQNGLFTADHNTTAETAVVRARYVTVDTANNKVTRYGKTINVTIAAATPITTVTVDNLPATPIEETAAVVPTGVTADYAYNGGTDSFDSVAARWTTTSGEPFTGTFVKGTEYNLVLTLTASTGYTFNDSTTADGFTAEVSADGGTLTLTKGYTPEEKSVSSITAAWATDPPTAFDKDAVDTIKENISISVTYNNSSTATINGTAEGVTLSGVEVGTGKTITVSYAGRTATLSAVTITDEATAADVSAKWSGSGNYGDTLTVTVTGLTEAAAGTVSLWDGNTQITAVSGGSKTSGSTEAVTLTYVSTAKALGIGTHALTVQFTADSGSVYTDATLKEDLSVTLGKAALTAVFNNAGAAYNGTNVFTIESGMVTLGGVQMDDDVSIDGDVGVTVTGALGVGTYSSGATVNTLTLTGAATDYYTAPTAITGDFTITAKALDNTMVADIANQTYTGTAITPSVTVTDGSKTLTLNTDYTVSYADNTNVGTATVNITGKGNYSGTVEKTFAITAKALNNTMVADIANQTYTGLAITPSVTVTDSGKTLTLNTDYTVSYADNTNVGTATVTIIGKGNYSGTVEKTFTITAKTLDSTMVADIANRTYTGTAITPSVTVTDGSKTLTAGTDYTVSYADNTNVGTATVNITGKGNYSGTVEKTFAITAKALNNTMVADIANQTYTGSAITPGVTITDGSKTLTLNTDYTVSYAENVNVGTATVTITGKGNYSGTVEKTFAITAKALNNTMVADIANQTYTGSAITPSVTVTDGSKTLTLNTDYTVSYADNTNVGTATVNITGKGNYSGTVEKTFTITAKALNNTMVTDIANQTYTGSAITPGVTVTDGGKTLTLNTDYTVSYADNVNVGTATVTIIGKGNYSGTVEKTFNIIAEERKPTEVSYDSETGKLSVTSEKPATLYIVTWNKDRFVLVEIYEITAGTDVGTFDFGPGQAAYLWDENMEPLCEKFTV